MRNVALVRADWTRRDPEITQALAALGRQGVPVYVLYRPGQGAAGAAGGAQEADGVRCARDARRDPAVTLK